MPMGGPSCWRKGASRKGAWVTSTSGAPNRLPAAQPDLTPQQAHELSAGFFAEIGVPSCRVDTSRHPLMHVTPTTDYIMLLSGEVSLLLDEGEPIPLQPFDVVVQRNTNHAWINTGSEAAVLMAVMVGQP